MHWVERSCLTFRGQGCSSLTFTNVEPEFGQANHQQTSEDYSCCECEAANLISFPAEVFMLDPYDWKTVPEVLEDAGVSCSCEIEFVHAPR